MNNVSFITKIQNIGALIAALNVVNISITEDTELNKLHLTCLSPDRKTHISLAISAILDTAVVSPQPELTFSEQELQAEFSVLETKIVLPTGPALIKTGYRWNAVRRANVLTCLQAGLTPKAIMVKLDISYSTTYKDINYLRDTLQWVELPITISENEQACINAEILRRKAFAATGIVITDIKQRQSYILNCLQNGAAVKDIRHALNVSMGTLYNDITYLRDTLQWVKPNTIAPTHNTDNDVKSIKEWRICTAGTAINMADLMQLSLTSYYRLENGIHHKSKDIQLVHFAQVAGITLEQIA